MPFNNALMIFNVNSTSQSKMLPTSHENPPDSHTFAVDFLKGSPGASQTPNISITSPNFRSTTTFGDSLETMVADCTLFNARENQEMIETHVFFP